MTRRLIRSEVPLTTGGLRPSALTASLLSAFDASEVPSDFYPWMIDGVLPDDWGIGMVVGASGTGKSTLLRSIGTTSAPVWEDDLPISAHFDDVDDAIDRLGAVGLNSVPVWARPYRVLSTGERFRADLARQIGDSAVIDEFTSTVSRTVAKSASRSLGKWVSRNGVRKMVLATCHFDVVEWVQPDWTIDTDSGSFNIGQHVAERWWVRYVDREEWEIVCEKQS